ncbi:Rid family hydrolase [soil metagenome]
MKMRIVTDAAPAPMPVFSQAVRKGPLLAVSGQGGADPATGVFSSDIAEQTWQTLHNLRAILDAAGSSFEDVIMLRVYLTTRDDFAAMNAVYADFLAEFVPSGILPSRTTVFPALPLPQMLVEIDALAVIE